MRLRHRLLLLFALVAVIPLLGVSAIGFWQSTHAVESLVREQVEAHAERMARVIAVRLERIESDAMLLAQNTDTQALLAGDPMARDRAAVRSRFSAYMDDAWQVMRAGYDRIEIRDTSGASVMVLRDAGESEAVGTGRPPEITRAIIGDTKQRLGAVLLWPRSTDLVPNGVLADGFGARRQAALVDRTDQRIIASAGLSGSAVACAPLPSIEAMPDRGVVRCDDGGERRLMSFVTLAPSPLAVLSGASIDEFVLPFRRQRSLDLVLILGIVACTTIAFSWLTRRVTGPLDALTSAAHRLSAGDLTPDLPATSGDEIGRLASAFGAMTVRLKEMIARIEADRQVTVLGRFAVELAHEIRNPLTAVKLNLQGLERDARDGRLTHESARAVAMALREIHRLDRTVHASLALGRPTTRDGHCAVVAVLGEALQLLQPQVEAARVVVTRDDEASRDAVRSDPDALKGAFVNILLNALQAMAEMPEGRPRTLHIATQNRVAADGTDLLVVTVADSGPGIPDEVRDRIFQPFFTTRPQGTGLGLSVALRTVTGSGGSIELGERSTTGAFLVATLPLAPVAVAT